MVRGWSNQVAGTVLLKSATLKSALLVSMLLVSGCMNALQFPYSASEDERLTATVMAGPMANDEVDLLYLDDHIKGFIDERIDRSQSAYQRFTALRGLLYGEDGLNIEYEADNTKTALQTYYAGAGNCLSLTSLFIASARYLDLPARYQKVPVRPTWNQEGTTMIRYEHIVATGMLYGRGRYVVDFLPDFVLDDFRVSPSSDNDALALYFNNLGAESFINGEFTQAVHYLRRSLHLRDDLSDTWTNMGAALRRSGQTDLAEFSYWKAVDLDRLNYSALNNLSSLIASQGREDEAETIREMVAKYRRKNPYYHYFLAQMLLRYGEYEQARLLLESAIRLKRDESQFYDTLARTYGVLGDPVKQEKMLALADAHRHQRLLPSQLEMNHRYWLGVEEVN